MANPKFYCDCSQYCKQPKPVSKTTWLRHRPFRLADEQKEQPARPEIDWGDLDNLIMISDSSSEDDENDILRDHDAPQFEDYDNHDYPDLPADPGVEDGAFEHFFELEEDRNMEIDEILDDEAIDPGSIVDDEQDLQQPILPLIPNDEVQHIPNIDEDPTISIDNLKVSSGFIHALKNASLDNDGLSPDTLQRLKNPPKDPLPLHDPDLRLAIDLFIQHGTKAYNETRNSILRRHPGDDILSHDQISQKVIQITGVDSIVHDMCLNTCVAYTGPFSALEACPECGTPRYDPIQLQNSNGRIKKPQQQFHTIPLGPQLQALFQSPETAALMSHRHDRTQNILSRQNEQGEVQIDVYDDVYTGEDYLRAVKSGHIAPDDIMLMLSMDGAQLFRNKVSDCWIYIWVIFNFPPDVRYKKKRIPIGGIFPGPNKPRIVESFLYPGLHHLIALQKDGFYIWDPIRDRTFRSKPFFHFGTADSMGVIYLNGLTGHKGAHGCRLYCALKGRRKPNGKGYFPALLKPDRYDVEGCNHDDVSAKYAPSAISGNYDGNLRLLLLAANNVQYRKLGLESGISRPSIISGIAPTDRLGIPHCLPADFMHLILNVADLILSIFRGTIDCDPRDQKQTWDWAVLQGDVWQAHGIRVAAATPYLPGSFDRPPRNPAEKISSGYKAWEYLLYIFGLGPALLYQVLPEQYWQHFCKLITAIRIFHQRSITKEQLVVAHNLLVEYVHEFETRYCQRKVERLHFARQSLHALLHVGPEVPRTGPQVYYTQWTMERTIGNLGEEIKQPSNPYANLSQRAIHRCQVNALKAMIPDLDPDDAKVPQGAEVLGNGYILLRGRDRSPQKLHGPEATAVKAYFEYTSGEHAIGWVPSIKRWARLKLPNGQVARSAWKERTKPLQKVRMSRNVKVLYQGTHRFAEVQYYFRGKVHDQDVTLALVSLYSPPNADLLNRSHHALAVCNYQGPDAFVVVEVKSILSVVAMVPFSGENPGDESYFLVEKPGLEVATLGGVQEEILEE